ncbi:MAG: anti-sigma F factor [Oscillospiraceae bacterium]|nr:anti-sigma F factor [Oscillospiraceae bacterium]
MKKLNYFKLAIPAKSVNEGFSRAAVSAFAALFDPTVEELSDIKTAVSEAVTNCIVHAYKEKDGVIYIDASAYDNGSVKIKIRDKGCGIADIEKAREALFTTSGDERSGLGFTVMESFSDKLSVRSKIGIGTTVTITKLIKSR